MAKTTLEKWQFWRGELAKARRDEAKALAAVHRGFKKASGGPTYDEHTALMSAVAKTIRTQNRLLAFVDRNKVK